MLCVYEIRQYAYSVISCRKTKRFLRIIKAVLLY